jgi:hypothetical protein
MSQEVLNEARISTFVREGEASAVPEHVRMNSYRQLGVLSDLRADVIESLSGHRPAFRQKNQRRIAARRVDALS